MTTLPDKQQSALDRLFFAIVTRGWDGQSIATYTERLHQHEAMLPPEIGRAFKLIDAKVTGLLTHVSLMIAGLGLIAPLVANSDFEVGVVVVEIAVYLLIAVGCLRCLSVFHARDFFLDPERTQQMVHRELLLRRELYSLCIRASIVFTIVVFLLLPLLYVWKPSR
jgi:hypothetical protein